MISITVPFPPSVNHYLVRSKTGHFYKSAKAKQYVHEVWAASRSVAIGLDVPLTVTYNYWFPKLSRRRDVGNYEKCLSDALVQAGVFADDSLIYRLVQERRGVDGRGRVEVTIQYYEGDGT